MISIKTDSQLNHLLGKYQSPVVVLFTAPWCAPCQGFHKTMALVEETFRGKAVVAVSDINESAFLAGKYAIMSVPALIILDKHGVQIGRIDGAFSRVAVEEKLTEMLK